MGKKILIAKPGLDGHWRGAMIISMALRDAGMEVIYMGNQTPEAIVKSASQEDVDVIGLSILAAGHLELTKETIELMKQRNMKDTKLIVGGTIPQEDIPTLIKMGVHAVFPPGSKVEKIVEFINQAS
jgi:methylmalonyl-CoA mutase, C-terminal domain